MDTKLSNAFGDILARFVPMLTKEISILNAIVDKVPTTLSAFNAVDSLLTGVNARFSDFISSVTSSNVISCLGISATLSEWKGKVKPQEHSQFVLALIDSFQLICQDHWNSFRQEICKAIKKQEHGPIIRGGSSIHIIPFIVNFEAIAMRIESSVGEWLVKDGSIVQSTRNVVPTRGKDGASPLLSPFESIDIVNSVSHSESVTKTPPGEICRMMADQLYSEALPQMFEAVENQSQQFEKHVHRIRLENFAYLRISLQSLPLKQAPMLKAFCTKAADERNSALKAYVDQNLIEAKFGQLIRVAEQLSQGQDIDDMDREAISRIDLDDPEVYSRLQVIKGKLRKELEESSPYLINVVWERYASLYFYFHTAF